MKDWKSGFVAEVIKLSAAMSPKEFKGSVESGTKTIKPRQTVVKPDIIKHTKGQVKNVSLHRRMRGIMDKVKTK